jgi:FkbM family methyltransferase
MNFSNLSYDTPIGKIVRAPLRFIPRKAVLPILQGPLRGKRWIAGSSDHGCWLGSYEAKKQHAFSDAIHTGDIIWDIGAHVGFYTLLAAVRAGPQGKVVAFEPFPANIDYLRRHLRLNKLDNVKVIEAAVSDSQRTMLFKTGASTTQGQISEEGEFEVRTVRLDDLLANRTVPAPNVIKIDIEGAEACALRGAQNTIATYRPLIFLATHGSEIRRDCRQLLASFGYHLESISGKCFEDEDEFIARPNGKAA